MEINKERFNKLRQLDRIEFRQKKDRINAWQEDSWGLMFGFMLICATAIYLLLIPQSYNAFGMEFLQSLSAPFNFLVMFLVALTVGGFGVDILLHSVRSKALKELEEEYFKLEVKK